MELYSTFESVSDKTDDWSILDDVFSKNLLSINDLVIYHDNLYKINHLAYNMPKTRNQIGTVLSEQNNKQFPIWFLVSIKKWIPLIIYKKVIINWLESDYNEISDFELKSIIDLSEAEDELKNKLFQKMLDSKDKSKKRLDQIGEIFKSASPSFLEKSCNQLAQSTPTTQIYLLSRNDISDNYIVIGLKALSKLKSQKNIEMKIDFSILNKLGPKSRLDAMKQLLGLFSKYNSKKIKEFPFKEKPTLEQVKEFLFPCSFKYNKQVADILSRFEQLNKTA